MHAIQLLLASSALCSAALAGDFRITASGTIASATGPITPFGTVQPGDAFVLTVEVLDPPVASTATSADYLADPFAGTVSIAGVTQGLNPGSVTPTPTILTEDSAPGGGIDLLGVGGGYDVVAGLDVLISLQVVDTGGTLLNGPLLQDNLGSILTSPTFASVGNANGFAFVTITSVLIEPSGGFTSTVCTPLPNTTGATGTLTANGSDLAADNDFTLVASNLPPGQFGIFAVARGVGPDAQVGSGNLCLAGPLGRFVQPGQILQADAAGAFQLVVDLTMIPTPTAFETALAGDTFYFQAWHRDGSPPSPTSNFTEGLEVTFR